MNHTTPLVSACSIIYSLYSVHTTDCWSLLPVEGSVTERICAWMELYQWLCVLHTPNYIITHGTCVAAHTLLICGIFDGASRHYTYRVTWVLLYGCCGVLKIMQSLYMQQFT